MTLFARESKTCVVCGAQAQFKVLSSSSEMGFRDLDFRPAEMLRSTMEIKVPFKALVTPAP